MPFFGILISKIHILRRISAKMRHIAVIGYAYYFDIQVFCEMGRQTVKDEPRQGSLTTSILP